MKATKAQIEQAEKISKAHKTQTVFVNKKGEYFTNENLASLSVSHKKENYTKISFKEKVVDIETDTDTETDKTE